MIRLNKKGQIDLDGLFMLFVNFIVIGLAISVGVFILYGANVDIRLDEAQTILNRISGSIVDNGYLNYNIFDKNFDVINYSGLDKNQFFTGGKYYVNIGISEDGKVVKVFDEGTKDYGVQCQLSGKNLPRCYYKSFVVLDRENPDKFFTVSILVASNNLGGKV